MNDIQTGFPPETSTQAPAQKAFFNQGDTSYFKFTGSGGEYFRIWIVNILLTIITIGIYGPWAKVRRLRYFYGHSFVENENFDFTGEPKKILKGRVIAIGVYILFSILSNLNPVIAIIGAIGIFFVMPWLLRATYRFMSRNSKYRNSRFYFFGSTKDAFITYFVWPVLALLLPGILMSLSATLEMPLLAIPAFLMFAVILPFLFHKHKLYQLDNLSVGNVGFSLEATPMDFIKAYLTPIILSLLISTVAGIVLPSIFSGGGMIQLMLSGNFALVILAGVIGYLMMFAIFFWIQATFYQTTWNNTFFGNSPLGTDVKAGRYIWISVTNVLLRIFTLGLGSPWAAVRMHRYKVDNMHINWQDNPDEIMAYSQQEPAAFGEELADILDLDISL